ncbi:MAG TPA: TIGR03435 family protein, partial [Acidobacteriaceae bacterium]
DGVRFHNLPLRLFLLTAYQPKAGFGAYTDQLLLNVPAWLNEHYDIDAKVAPEDIPRWKSELMAGELHHMALQHLLQDRCKLQVHFVPVAIDGYALRVANPGKLVPYEEGEVLPKNTASLMDGGITTGVTNPDRPEMKFYNTTMDVLAVMLSRSRALVVDETGLPGHYDFSIWRIAETENRTVPPPDIPWDLRAAGLKVVPRKVVVQAVYLDHIERPDAN